MANALIVSPVANVVQVKSAKNASLNILWSMEIANFVIRLSNIVIHVLQTKHALNAAYLS